MNYFDTIYLFIFLPVAMLIYQLTKRKFRWITLLVLSCFVYYTMSEKLIIVFAATSFFTYLIARIIQNRNDNGKKSKGFLILGIVGLFLTLIIFKYTGFLEQNLNVILAKLKVKQLPDVGNIIMPMGISFYTLEAVGYITDVYWKKIKAEKNPLKVMLFLGFFPQIMEGPIALYSQTSSKLFEGNPITADNISQGGIRIFIGLFKKIVIADRLSMMVSRLYKNPLQYHGAMIAGAAIVYTIHLYLEFSGTMDVVNGSAKLFGISLPENFKQPFFSKDASEFWRRWHISLGVWFRTYIFYPVSVSKMVRKWNKKAKKKYGKYVTKLGTTVMCLLPVWIGNGIWHGAQWNYIFYGVYYFIILFVESALEPVRKKAEKKINTGVFNVARTLKTWCIIFIGEMLFRSDGVIIWFKMLERMFYKFRISDFAGLIHIKGVNFILGDYLVIFVGIILIAIYDILKEKNISLFSNLGRFEMPVRCVVYYALILSIVIFGAYGTGYEKVDMIYAGF